MDGTRPVGLKLPNELGLYDMSGNVTEWCWDKINAGNNQAADTSTSITTDYRGPTTGTNARRISHGGDWENSSAPTIDRPSIWNRTGLYTQIGYTQSGIRLVINAETSGE